MNTLPLRGIPAVLRDAVAAHWENFLRVAPDSAEQVLACDAVAGSLAQVWACSEFVAASCVRDRNLLPALVEEGSLTASRPPGSPAEAGNSCAGGQEDALRKLRRARRRALVRIAWRDLAGWAELEETLADLSAHADASIAAAHDFARRELRERFGVPRAADGSEQTLVILAMGKLGGRELNFSSDVDLVFLFPRSGQTDGRRSISNERFFARLGQRVISLLETATEDGFVYRVDMRLRPFGDSGPLTMSFAALETYLQNHGREWERYAYVKARPLTGHDAAQGLYAEILRPFVYRRYLDYGVFESLRQMKDLIAREVERRDLQDNIKLGPGGIREIEFMVQALQLIRGGRRSELRAPELLRVLPRLQSNRLLSPTAVAELAAAYRFLRSLENRLQAWDDAQIHDLPRDETARLRLACAMDYPDWSTLQTALEAHRRAVGGHFRNIVLSSDQVGAEGGSDFSLMGVWEQSQDREQAERALSEIGIRAPQPVAEILATMRGRSLYRRLDETGRKRLDALVPKLLRALAQVEAQETALQRLAGIIDAVGRRSAYLSLLYENPQALERLTRLCALSEFLAGQIAAHPLLLDELLDPRIFEAPPERPQFETELQQRLASVPNDDLERQMEELRLFQRAAMFRVAVADLSGILPLMRVSDRLTDIAELVLEKAVDTAWQHLTRTHGTPMCGDDERQLRPTGFAVIGYGKLGGIELGYGSDLDLVFMHDSQGRVQRTTGERPIDNQVFFARLGRRIVHILTTQTSQGALYEVDMRLRPSGRAGLLVTSLSTFETYQRDGAWTWEHQALLRARALVGTPAVRTGFERIRRAILCEAVKRESLRQDVCAMRRRMRRELSRSGADEFDIKQDRGGLADMEFLVQYWVLRAAARIPHLLRYSDNIRQLEALAGAAIVPVETAERLTDIYRGYRRRLHRLSLSKARAVVGSDEFTTERAEVSAIWDTTLGEPE